MRMSKVVSLAVTLACLLALWLGLASCLGEQSKDGTISLKNSSSFSEDNPVTATLSQGGSVLGESSLGAGKTVKWTGVPAEVSTTITVTDKNGKSRTNSYIYLDLGGSRSFYYNGSGIYEYSN